MNLFKKTGKFGPVRDRSDFNEALHKLHRLHQESGEEKLAPIPLEIPAMAPIIEFFLQHLAAVERFLVELMTINKKVHN